jgi:hypothetical protein
LLRVEAGGSWLRRLSEAYLGVGRNLLSRVRRAVDIQLEDSRDYDDGLRTVSILEHCELEGFGSIDEQPAAEPLFIPHDPMAVAVPADSEQA